MTLSAMSASGMASSIWWSSSSMRSATAATNQGDRAVSTYARMLSSAALTRQSGSIMADTAAGSRRPPTKRSESTSASLAANDVTSATSPACRASDSTAPMLGPTNGTTCAGDTNQLDNVALADDRCRAASPSSWAAVSSSASRAARRPLSMARAPAVMSLCTETTPSAAPTSMRPSTVPPMSATGRVRAGTRRPAWVYPDTTIGSAAAIMTTAVSPWNPTGSARSRATHPRPATNAPRARLRVSRTTDQKATPMAMAAHATAQPSNAKTAAAPAGRNHVQRRAVAPKNATTAARAPLQNTSAPLRPVGSASDSAPAAAATAATATPNVMVRVRRERAATRLRTATDMETTNLVAVCWSPDIISAPRGKEALIRAGSPDDRRERLEDDGDVHGRRPMVDVVEVEPHGLLPRQVGPPAHLPQPGDARFDQQSAVDVVLVHVDLGLERRPRPHHRHLPSEHVPQLRQLVDRVAAQGPPHPGDARVGAQLEQHAVGLVAVLEVGHQALGADDHRTELDHGEPPPVAPHPGLLEEHGPAAVELDGERHRQEHRGEQHQADQRAHAVPRVLDHALRPGERGLLDVQERQPRHRAHHRAGAGDVGDGGRDQPLHVGRRHHPRQVAKLARGRLGGDGHAVGGAALDRPPDVGRGADDRHPRAAHRDRHRVGVERTSGRIEACTDHPEAGPVGADEVLTHVDHGRRRADEHDALDEPAPAPLAVEPRPQPEPRRQREHHGHRDEHAHEPP